MHISLVTYKKVFYTGSKYFPEHIGVEVVVHEQESPELAFQIASDFVEKVFKEKYAGTPYVKGNAPTDDGELPEIQVEKNDRQTAINGLLRDISNCTKLKELKSFEIFIKPYPEVEYAYNERLTTLLATTIDIGKKIISSAKP